MKRKLEEQVIQRFPYRCPYCDQPISYNQLDLKKGENKIECPSCKKIYIKVVGDSLMHSPLPRREGIHPVRSKILSKRVIKKILSNRVKERVK